MTPFLCQVKKRNPCRMGTGYFPGVKSGWGVTLTTHPLLVPWPRKSRAIPLLPLWAIWPVQSLSACTRVHLPLLPYQGQKYFLCEDKKGEHHTSIFWNVSLELTITDIGVVRSASLQYFSVSQTSYCALDVSVLCGPLTVKKSSPSCGLTCTRHIMLEN